MAASWAISVYYAYQRTWKPFNPILGETYEMVNHHGITFISEQVSIQGFWISVKCVYFSSLSYIFSCMLKVLSYSQIFSFLIILPSINCN